MCLGLYRAQNTANILGELFDVLGFSMVSLWRFGGFNYFERAELGSAIFVWTFLERPQDQPKMDPSFIAKII